MMLGMLQIMTWIRRINIQISTGNSRLMLQVYQLPTRRKQGEQRAMTDRELLRLNIEAVWEISAPPFDSAIVELPATAPLPSWSLYRASLAHEQVTITIWRPDVLPDERADLLERAQFAGVVYDLANSMRREVVLHCSGARPVPDTRPQHIARPLTQHDVALLEAFEAGSASYFLDPEHAPCIGIVVTGKLVSVAHSSRRTAAACELGINTLPDARRHGYATAATCAWTAAIQREGLEPIYSAFAHNTASLRLAATTGYRPMSECVYGPVSATEK